MKILLLALLAIVAISVAVFLGGRYMRPNNTAEENPPATTTPEATSTLIRVSNPRENDVISNPLLVAGEARGNWYFEASFPVTVVDINGYELGAGIATAKGEWMTENFVPFEGVISFSSSTSEKGYVIFKKDNPSGLPENDAEIKIPVRFR